MHGMRIMSNILTADKTKALKYQKQNRRQKITKNTDSKIFTQSPKKKKKVHTTTSLFFSRTWRCTLPLHPHVFPFKWASVLSHREKEKQTNQIRHSTSLFSLIFLEVWTSLIAEPMRKDFFSLQENSAIKQTFLLPKKPKLFNNKLFCSQVNSSKSLSCWSRFLSINSKPFYLL